jgi:DNA-binding HxlR family transcriptional regulator
MTEGSEDLPQVPVTGRPVRGWQTGRPVMALLDLLGRRWTMRLLWELRDGPMRFVALRKAAGGMSQSVLVVRLAELTAAGIVEETKDGYALTPRGRTLTAQLVKLDRWALEWAEHLAADD